MDIEKFIKLRRYLYHLTDSRNLDSILSDRTLKSTSVIASLAGLSAEDDFLTTRRKGHKTLSAGNVIYYIRDQDPLNETLIKKNLENGFTLQQFIRLLNSKVFFWAKGTDLKGHYGRYRRRKEYPIVLKIKTEQLFELNTTTPMFCRLNSGAPSYFTDGKPPRGPKIFLPANEYSSRPGSVREVTFDQFCKLPSNVTIIRKLTSRSLST